MTTKEQYTKDLESAFDWQAIVKDCVHSAVDALEYIELDKRYMMDDAIDESGNIVGRCYLGTVFALCPSGKYYMPWACSNVNPCPECHGDGHARYTTCAFEDVDCTVDMCNECIHNKTRLPILQGCPYCNATGKRTIAELAELRNETYQDCLDHFLAQDIGILWDDTPNSHYILCSVCKHTPVIYGTGKVFVTCPSCEGLGSREAHLDQLWYEALEQVTNAHGGWNQNGEGDPCDIFYCRWVTPQEIVEYLGDDLADNVKAWLKRTGAIREVKASLRKYRSNRNKLDRLSK